MKGDCLPDVGQTDNFMVLSKWNGTLTVTVRSTWNALSAWPNCNGSIRDITVVNDTGVPQSVYVNSTSKGTRTVTIQPGATVYSGGQLKQMGLEAILELSEVIARRL